MDVLRENQRNGEREINHHGLTISVENADADKKVFQPRNQMSDEDGAPKNILRRGIDKFRKLTNITLLEISEFAAKKGIPIVVITFSTFYWTYGLYFFYYPMYSLE